MKNAIGSGDIITIVAPANLVSGQAFIVGSLFLVAQADALSGDEVACARTGVFKLPKLSTDVNAVGEKLNWNDVNKNLQELTSDLDGVATVVEANLSGSTEVVCVLTAI